MVELVDGETRRITWPANDVPGRAHRRRPRPRRAQRRRAAPAWPIVRRLRRRGRRRGSAARPSSPSARPPTPSRTPACRRSSAAPPTPELARRLALSAPTYQGITGLIGVLHAELERAGVPTISLRVGVPHYLAHTEHPLAVDAPCPPPRPRARRAARPSTCTEQIDRWAAQHDEAVADDEQLRAYVRMLEIEYDRRAEATLRAADDLADRFEEFLRDQRRRPRRDPEPPRRARRGQLSAAARRQPFAAAKPLSRSARMSSIVSRPTDRRTRPGVHAGRQLLLGRELAVGRASPGGSPGCARRRCWPGGCAARAPRRTACRPRARP